MTDYPYRLVELPSEKAIRRLMDDAERTIRAHRPVHKMYLSMGVWIWSTAVGRKIPTDLRWPTDLVHSEEHPVADVLRPVLETSARHLIETGVYQRSQDIVDALMDETPLVYVTLKSMAFSDDLNWFVPSEDLVWSLLATDLVGLLARDVVLPLPVLFIEVPPGIFWSRSRRGLHEVRAIAVTDGHVDLVDQGIVQGRRLMISLIREPLPTDTAMDDVSSLTFSVPLHDDSAQLADLVELEDEFASRHLHGARHSDDLWGRVGGVDRRRVEFRDSVVSFILGVLMYLTTPTATKRPRHAGERKTKGKRKDAATAVMRNKEWLIGTEVKVSSEVREAVSHGTRTAHVVKTLVRGFFRRQHHGPRHSLVKIVWIAPHVRNFGLPGPIQGHTYKE